MKCSCNNPACAHCGHQQWKHYPTGVEVHRSDLFEEVYVRLSQREAVRTTRDVVDGVDAEFDLDGNIVGLTMRFV